MERKMDDLELSLKFEGLRKESEVNMPDDVENSLIMFLTNKAKEWIESGGEQPHKNCKRVG